jgi:tight adherence protein C
MALTIAATLFFLVTGLVTLFGYRRYVRAGQVYESLQPDSGPSEAAPGMPALYSVTGFVEGVGKRLPPSPASAAKFRTELIAAGYRSPQAPAIYYGSKVTLAALLGFAGLLAPLNLRLGSAIQAAYVAIGALGGYRLPDFILARRLKRRQRRLRQALPDAIDLMVLCAEAGLAIDRTLRVVARELALVHPELTDELNLLTLEVTAGTRRREALENLALRTQEPAVRRLVTVLAQAERFGTEISEALRAHSEHMRTRRRIDAEERAGKVAVKLVFPIFLFILPCIILVTAGPAALQIWKNVLPSIQG